MDWWIILAVFLYFACAILIVAEIFVPSGGLISICAMACLVGGLMIFFRSETVPGWLGIIVAVVEIPIVLVISWKIFPRTGFGKAVLLEPPDRSQGDAIADNENLNAMMGKIGQVITPLRPVGTVEFEGKRLECVAESGYVDKGINVEVIKVESTQLTVRLKNNDQ